MARIVLSGSNCTQNNLYCWAWVLDGMEYQLAIRRDLHGTPMLAYREDPPEGTEGTDLEPRWQYKPLDPIYTCDGSWRSFRRNVASFMEVQRALRPGKGKKS